MSIKPNIYRRDFLKLAALFLASTAAVSCSPIHFENNQPQIETIPGFGGPSLPLYLALTGLQFEKTKQAQALIEVQKVLNNPEQADWLLSTLARNWRRAPRMAQIREALARGDGFGWTDCPDSRLTIPDAIPRLNLSDLSPSVIAGNGTNNIRMNIVGEELIDYSNWDTNIPVDAVVEVRQIGAQPSLFPRGINKSVFLTHEAIEGCEFGCGFLSGVDELIKNPKVGIGILIDHGVPDETIGYIEKWIAQNQSRFVNPMKIGPKEWARIGAELQAHINSQKYGGDHLVLWGVRQHGTETVIPMGVVDQFGRERDFSEVQVLKDAVDYINRPHPAFEQTVAGQQPGVNIISTSTKGPSYYFGEFEQNAAFVVNHDATTITKESLESLMTGAGYTTGALTQRGNIVELLADSDIEMTKLRQAFLSTSFADDFIKNGGLIVELVPDEFTGLIKKNIVLRNYENPLMMLTLSPEEELIAKNGVQKISGAVKLVERADNPNMMIVIVRSAKDGKDYSLQIPKTAGYSGITAEILEEAGLPIVEASKFEQFFVKCGGLLGKGLLAAGLIWMTVDGLKYISDDLMNRGKYVQLNPSSEIKDLPVVNDDIVNSLKNLNLIETAAYTFYKKNTKQIEDLMSKRVDDSLALATQGQGYDPSFLLKLDANQVGVPLAGGPDSDVDYYTSIRVTPQCDWNTGWFDGDGHYHPTIIGITFENVLTHEIINLTKNAEGKFENESTIDSLKFLVLVESPTGEMYTIPFKFHVSDDLQNIIAEPDYFSEATSMIPPPEYSPPDIASYEKEYGKLAGLFRAMDKVLAVFN